MTNDNMLGNLKQFIDGRLSRSEQPIMLRVDEKISQSEQNLTRRLEAKNTSLDKKADNGFAAIAEILQDMQTCYDTTTSDLDGHVTVLEQRAA